MTAPYASNWHCRASERTSGSTSCAMLTIFAGSSSLIRPQLSFLYNVGLQPGTSREVSPSPLLEDNLPREKISEVIASVEIHARSSSVTYISQRRKPSGN